jgi:hypothetical protein
VHAPPQVAEARAVVRPLPPRSAYPSTARNSIRSRAWAAPLDGCSFQVRVVSGVVDGCFGSCFWGWRVWCWLRVFGALLGTYLVFGGAAVYVRVHKK